jgi:hypothetical protein
LLEQDEQHFAHFNDFLITFFALRAKPSSPDSGLADCRGFTPFHRPSSSLLTIRKLRMLNRKHHLNSLKPSQMTLRIKRVSSVTTEANVTDQIHHWHD